MVNAASFIRVLNIGLVAPFLRTFIGEKLYKIPELKRF
jgi:hypothetical protein